MGNHSCRVCGLYRKEMPWGEDGNTPTYDICPCCGVEFGYEDYTIESLKEYREQWIANGAKWSEPKEEPEDWNLEKQMRNISDKFR